MYPSSSSWLTPKKFAWSFTIALTIGGKSQHIYHYVNPIFNAPLLTIVFFSNSFIKLTKYTPQVCTVNDKHSRLHASSKLHSDCCLYALWLMLQPRLPLFFTLITTLLDALQSSTLHTCIVDDKSSWLYTSSKLNSDCCWLALLLLL